MSIYLSVRLSIGPSIRMDKLIAELVRPRTTKFSVKTSYICTQNKFISNIECHAPFGRKYNKMI